MFFYMLTPCPQKDKRLSHLKIDGNLITVYDFNYYCDFLEMDLSHRANNEWQGHINAQSLWTNKATRDYKLGLRYFQIVCCTL